VFETNTQLIQLCTCNNFYSNGPSISKTVFQFRFCCCVVNGKIFQVALIFAPEGLKAYP